MLVQVQLGDICHVRNRTRTRTNQTFTLSLLLVRLVAVSLGCIISHYKSTLHTDCKFNFDLAKRRNLLHAIHDDSFQNI